MTDYIEELRGIMTKKAPLKNSIALTYLDKIFNYSDFDKAVEPAIRYLFKNHHPHTKIYIDYSNAELLEGQRTHNLNEEVPD